MSDHVSRVLLMCEIALPPAMNAIQQQERFDTFLEEFNHERSLEGHHADRGNGLGVRLTVLKWPAGARISVA